MDKIKKNNISKTKSNFYLISSLLSLFAVLLSWTKFSGEKMGIADIIHVFYETAREKIAHDGLSTFSYSFFLYSFFKSNALENFFKSRGKKIEENKFSTIFFFTFISSLLASSLS
jgi:hypothetical protein